MSVYGLQVLLSVLLLASGGADASAQLIPVQEQALRQVRQGRVPVWPGLSEAQRQDLAALAIDYERDYQTRHRPHGYTANLRWTDRERTQLIRYDGLGDGAIWTGHYLAAQAFHYAVEPSPALLDELHETLAAIDLLTLVSGRAGYVARYLGPASDPYYQPYYGQFGGFSLHPGLGAEAYPGAPPHDHLVWLGSSSRDTFDGIHFGLAAVWNNVPDPAIRAQVRAIVQRVGERLVSDRFLLLDGQGNFELPNPAFYCAWLRLMLTVCPDTFRADQRYYDFAAWIYLIIDRFLGPNIRGIDEGQYYANNLGMIRLYTLCTLEPDREQRAAFHAILRRNYRDHFASHLNAHFAAIYMVATGDRPRDAVATLEGGVGDFPEEKFLHEPESDSPDQSYAGVALLVHQRPMSDFIWQRPPARLPQDEPSTEEYPGIDFLLPYWMGRSLGYFAEP